MKDVEATVDGKKTQASLMITIPLLAIVVGAVVATSCLLDVKAGVKTNEMIIKNNLEVDRDQEARLRAVERAAVAMDQVKSDVGEIKMLQKEILKKVQ